MKLNKKILKSLIVESLEEMHDPQDEMTGTAYDDVRAGMESEPQPEDFETIDIVSYFKQVGEELQNQISMLEKMPRLETGSVLTPEGIKEALEEMNNVQKELEDVKETLKRLEKEIHRKQD